MKILNTVPLILEGYDDELITVTVLPKSTVHMLSCAWDEGTFALPEGQPIRIALDKTKNKKSTLSLFCHFSGDTGGSYDIEIQGNLGGDVVRQKVLQSPGRDPEVYTFSLIGGVKIPPP